MLSNKCKYVSAIQYCWFYVLNAIAHTILHIFNNPDVYILPRKHVIRTGRTFYVSRTTVTLNSSLLINMNKAEERRKNSTEVHLCVYYSWRTIDWDTVTQSESHWVKCISLAGSNYSLVLALWLIALCAIHHPCYIYRILTSIMRSFVTIESMGTPPQTAVAHQAPTA